MSDHCVKLSNGRPFIKESRSCARDVTLPAASTFYLPMHGVVKDSSSTTKLRIVFYGSARSSTGVSLNDALLPGPSLYPLLSTIIGRFRTFPAAISGDISKMFREVGCTSLTEISTDSCTALILGR